MPSAPTRRALRLFLISTALMGCNLEPSTTVDTTDSAAGDTGDVESGGETGGDSPEETADTGDPPSPYDVDDDGDGLTENQGDCDDQDPNRFPGAPDLCDKVDNDCDGVLDEDAAQDDPFEPNDDAWYDLGSLEDSFSVVAWLHNDTDVDRFSFAAEDLWYESFNLDIQLSEIPSFANFVLTVGRVAEDGSLEDPQEVYGGTSLEVVVEDTTFVDDGGTWGVVVESIGGADCGRSYLLTVTH